MPQLLPMLKPFAEAVAFQRARVPMTRSAFDALEGDAKARAFTIAGLARRDLLTAAYQEATRAIAEGLTRTEFLDRLGEILDKQGGLFLTPQRLELIAQNNFATAYSAGRYAQMNDPEITRLRPYRQYPMGPHDDRTSEICLQLEGLVARYDDPIWQHITPPNHHNERHIKVLTLTEEQAKEHGIYESGDGPKEYPIGKGGGELHPDPGFDYAPSSLFAMDEAHLAAVGQALNGVTSAQALGLDPLATIAKGAQAAPATTPLSEGAIVDVFGDGAIVTSSTLDALDGEVAPWVTAAMTDPVEVWFLEYEGGRTGKRYVAVWKKRGVWVEVTPDGWVSQAGMTKKPESIEWVRQGIGAWRAGR